MADLLSQPTLALEALLLEMQRRQASDLHLSAGQSPMFRVHGDLRPAECLTAPLSAKDTQVLTYAMISEAQRSRFEETQSLDFAFGIEGLSRYRGNAYRQRGTVAVAVRAVPMVIKSLDDLALPPILSRIAEKQRGLVLVTGPTGSGKSTTLAAILHKINCERAGHILTLEEPIEFVHPHRKCLVNQREVGTDVPSFKDGLRYALREDPDVILLGEMRDLETISAALTIAETGHLCLATLHAHSAPEAINRIIDSFPHEQHGQVRQQLAATLEAVITQDLVPLTTGTGRVLCCEILLSNNAVQGAIREQKTSQLLSIMQASRAEGMQTMNSQLLGLVERGLITAAEAIRRSPRWQELKMELERAGFGDTAAVPKASSDLRF